jgi:hypothetical protein
MSNGTPDRIEPDISCVPYPRKRTYLILTVPFLALLVAVAVYLWTVSFVLALVFILLFVATNLFQSYCCAYQDCPYAGGFCPAVAGIMPSGLLAKVIAKRIRKSRRLFSISAAIAFVALLGLLVFPLYWIAQIGIAMVIGYFVLNIIYYVTFLLSICPVCAIRDTCPGGRLRGTLRK